MAMRKQALPLLCLPTLSVILTSRTEIATLSRVEGCSYEAHPQVSASRRRLTQRCSIENDTAISQITPQRETKDATFHVRYPITGHWTILLYSVYGHRTTRPQGIRRQRTVPVTPSTEIFSFFFSLASHHCPNHIVPSTGFRMYDVQPCFFSAHKTPLRTGERCNIIHPPTPARRNTCSPPK